MPEFWSWLYLCGFGLVLVLLGLFGECVDLYSLISTLCVNQPVAQGPLAGFHWCYSATNVSGLVGTMRVACPHMNKHKHTFMIKPFHSKLFSAMHIYA